MVSSVGWSDRFASGGWLNPGSLQQKILHNETASRARGGLCGEPSLAGASLRAPHSTLAVPAVYCDGSLGIGAERATRMMRTMVRGF